MERLRQLRNECRKFMTGSTKTITKKQQAAWWAAEPRRAYLFGDVGFALIRREHGVNWITLGLTEKARGTGLGTMIYYSFPGSYAKIRLDNLASIRAAQKAGYRPIEQDDEFMVLAS